MRSYNTFIYGLCTVSSQELEKYDAFKTKTLTHFVFCNALQEWVVLGNIDIEAFVDEHLSNITDWERNFKGLKARGRDAEKLPK